VQHYTILQCQACQENENVRLFNSFFWGVMVTLIVVTALAMSPSHHRDSKLRGLGVPRPKFEAPTPQPGAADVNATLAPDVVFEATRTPQPASTVENATLTPEAAMAPESAVEDVETLDREIMSELLQEHIAAAEEALAAEAVEEVLEDHRPCRVAFSPAGEIRLTPGNSTCVCVA
jgi:hypothetical protein